MSKKPHERRLKETEAQAVGQMIRTSPRKLELVAGLIRGKKVDTALAELAFSKRRMARDVRRVLQSAIANAENNHQLDVDRLFVSEASVGKALVMRRFHARGRGRGAPVRKPFSRILIVVGEREEKKADKPAAKASKSDKPAKSAKAAPKAKAAKAEASKEKA